MGDVFEIGRNGEVIVNYCDKSGALLLKRRIEEYWRERGADVHVTLHGAGFISAMRFARTDVRSDMVDGFPPALPSQQSEAA